MELSELGYQVVIQWLGWAKRVVLRFGLSSQDIV